MAFSAFPASRTSHPHNSLGRCLGLRHLCKIKATKWLAGAPSARSLVSLCTGGGGVWKKPGPGWKFCTSLLPSPSLPGPSLRLVTEAQNFLLFILAPTHWSEASSSLTAHRCGSRCLGLSAPLAFPPAAFSPVSTLPRRGVFAHSALALCQGHSRYPVAAAE